MLISVKVFSLLLKTASTEKAMQKLHNFPYVTALKIQTELDLQIKVEATNRDQLLLDARED